MRQNVFPQVRNLEAFALYDLNKDGRLTSEDLAALKQSGELPKAAGLAGEFERVKEALTEIMFAPKGFRNPHIDPVAFNRATRNESVLFPLLASRILALRPEPLSPADLALFSEIASSSSSSSSSSEEDAAALPSLRL